MRKSRCASTRPRERRSAQRAGLEPRARAHRAAIGFVLLSYGKKMSRPPQLLAGLLLLVFPYFVFSAVVILLIAGVLLGVL